MRFCQACSPRETRYSCAQGKSDGQPGPTLGTACIDDATAILGTHAGAKTMGALSLQIAGLIGSFHVTLHPVVYTIKNRFLARQVMAEKGAKGTVFNAVLSTSI